MFILRYFVATAIIAAISTTVIATTSFGQNTPNPVFDEYYEKLLEAQESAENDLTLNPSYLDDSPLGADGELPSEIENNLNQFSYQPEEYTAPAIKEEQELSAQQHLEQNLNNKRLQRYKEQEKALSINTNTNIQPQQMEYTIPVGGSKMAMPQEIYSKPLGMDEYEYEYPDPTAEDINNIAPAAGIINPIAKAQANPTVTEQPEPMNQAQQLNQTNSMPEIKGTSIPVSELPRVGTVIDLNKKTVPKHQNTQHMKIDVEKLQQNEEPVFYDAPSVTEAKDIPPRLNNTPAPAAKQNSMQSAGLNADPKTPYELASFGILLEKNGGFAGDLWKDMSQADAEKSLASIVDKGVRSLTGRKILERMLLSKSVPPKAGTSKANWLTIRSATLQDLGMTESSNMLISGSGISTEEVNKYPHMGEVWVSNALQNGNTKEACIFTKGNILNNNSKFWRRALVTCQMLENDSKGLELSLSLITDEEKMEDKILFHVIDYVTAELEAPILAPKAKLSPMAATLYANTPALLTPNVIVKLPDSLLRKVANNAKLTISQRIQAAEQLTNINNNETNIILLSGLYEIPKFDADSLKSPSLISMSMQELDGSIARAMLWQGAKAAELQSTRALTLKALWDRAENDNLTDLPAALTPNLRGIRASANLAWFAPQAVKTGLKSGNINMANKWWSVLKSNHSLSKDLSSKRADISLAFSFVDGELDKNALTNWWSNKSQIKNLKKQTERLKVQRELSLLEAFDMKVEDDMWLTLHRYFNDANTDQGKGPGPLWLRMLGTSLQNKQEGKSLLILLEPLLYNHPSNMAPQGISNIITGLRFMGMDNEAISLTMEALLQNGYRAL